MKKGYQIIEPPALGPLIRDPKHSGIAVALLSWLAERVKLEARNKIADVEIEVIRVTYLGNYPAIGLRYLNDESPDAGDIVLSEMHRVLKEQTALDFVKFVAESGVSWSDVANRLMSAEE